jgi:hypothetical protein
MACSLGLRSSGADSEAALVHECAMTYRALFSERALLSATLPLVPCEPPIIDLSIANGGIGCVDAPSCLYPNNLSITCLQKRVHPGHTAALVLVPPATVGCRVIHASVLATLAALVKVSVELWLHGDTSVLQAAAILPAPANCLPVVYEPSLANGGVLICIPVPPSAPEGSCIMLSGAFVAGCAVALGDAPVPVSVGFNHAHASAGPLYAAAEAGDVPAVVRLLNDDASTEERGEVSVVFRQDLMSITSRFFAPA